MVNQLMSNSTLFAVIGSFQTWENYSDEPVTAPYWKAKGEHVVIIHEGLTLEQVQLLGTDTLDMMFEVSTPRSDEYFDFTGGDWRLVTLDAALIEYVRELIASEGDDLGYTRYLCKHGEFAFDWAVRQEPSLVSGFSGSWNAFDIMRIMGHVMPPKQEDTAA